MWNYMSLIEHYSKPDPVKPEMSFSELNFEA
jgi:hypothetical protein